MLWNAHVRCCCRLTGAQGMDRLWWTLAGSLPLSRSQSFFRQQLTLGDACVYCVVIKVYSGVVVVVAAGKLKKIFFKCIVE
jgi:hypothetical protein